MLIESGSLTFPRLAGRGAHLLTVGVGSRLGPGAGSDGPIWGLANPDG